MFLRWRKNSHCPGRGREKTRRKQKYKNHTGIHCRLFWEAVLERGVFEPSLGSCPFWKKHLSSHRSSEARMLWLRHQLAYSPFRAHMEATCLTWRSSPPNNPSPASLWLVHSLLCVSPMSAPPEFTAHPNNSRWYPHHNWVKMFKLTMHFTTEPSFPPWSHSLCPFTCWKISEWGKSLIPEKPVGWANALCLTLRNAFCNTCPVPCVLGLRN